MKKGKEKVCCKTNFTFFRKILIRIKIYDWVLEKFVNANNDDILFETYKYVNHSWI